MKRSAGLPAICAALAGLVLIEGPSLAEPNPERQAYFGETHVHTSWSLDAFAIGNVLTNPGDAYKYFKGEPIKHPLDYDVKIDTPLDWAGVTDHSEYAGVVNLANEPGSALADQANEPGKFTAFCSYEWTSMPNNMNLHRNIFFEDCAKVPPMPFSALDSKHPVDLWQWMDVQRKAGNELLAISHNANLSDGRMFPTEVDSKGRPIDAAYAASRVRNEPLIEIKQLKGTSETHPLLSPKKIVTDLVGTPIEIAVYKLGDKYLGARSNEFGYANYEIIPAVAELSPLGAAPR